MALKGFDTQYFIDSLLAYAQAEFDEWGEDKTTSDVEELVQNMYPEAADLDAAAEQFFMDYEIEWGLSPNAYFDAGEYRQAWAEKQVELNQAFTVQDALDAYDAQVAAMEGGHYAHYLAYGAAEGVNPSNDFDESEYLQSLIDGLELDITVDELRDAATEAGLTALDFFVDYPELQAEYPAIPVPEDEQVDGGDPVAPTPGQTFTLTNVADAIPGLEGSDGTADTSGDDIIIGTDDTLTAGDIIDAGAGNNVLRVFQNDAGGNNYAAVEIDNVQEIDVTADAGPARLDLSGATGVELLKSTNSDQNVGFAQVTSLADLFLNNTTGAPDVIVQYQNGVVSGDADEIDVTIEDSEVGTLLIGRVGDDDGGIETINLENFGDASSIVQLDSNMTTLNVAGTGDIYIDRYLNGTERLVEASGFEGDLDIAVGQDLSENTALEVNNGSGDDILWISGGNVDVSMADGDDRVVFDPRFNTTNNHGFRSDDILDGGDGTDTLQIGVDPFSAVVDLGGVFNLSTTEFNNKTSFEVIDIRALNADLTLFQDFVDSAQDTLIVRTDMVNTDRGIAAEEIDEQSMTTELNLAQLNQNTSLQYIGGDGSDRLELNNAVFNSALNLDGGSSYNDSTVAGTGDYDTLTVIGGSAKTVIDAPDLSNVQNFEGLNLVKPGTVGSNVVFDIELTEAFVLANTADADALALTTMNDQIFQVFSEAVEGASQLSTADTVNIDISDLLDPDGTAKDSLTGRIDFTDLLNTTATVNFMVDGRAATAAEIAAISFADTVVGRQDVIASRINPVDMTQNILIATAANFDTTSGFMIQEGNMATAGDDLLIADAGELTGNPAINMGAGNDELQIDGLITAANLGGVNAALTTGAAAATLENVTIVDGSGANMVTGGNGQDITALAGSSFTLAGAGTIGTGSDDADTIQAAAGGSTLLGNGGADTLLTSAGNDTVNGGTGNDVIFVTGGNDAVVAGAGADTVMVALNTNETHALVLGDAGAPDADQDTVFIVNTDFVDAEDSVVAIADFDAGTDLLRIVSDDHAGGVQAVSDGGYTEQMTDFNGGNASAGEVIEIDGNVYQYTHADDTASLLNRMADANLINLESGAGLADDITVIWYNADGDAAIYVAHETTGVADAAFDELELVGVLEGVGINALDSDNFA